MVKQVLIIAFYFPPLSGGGVQRTLKFVKYLQEYGWQPLVLTINPDDIKSYVKDNALLEELPDSVSITRSRYLDVTRFPLFRGSAARIFFGPFKDRFLIPSDEVTWNLTALGAARKIIEQTKPRLVFTTSPPNSVHLLGLKIRQQYSIPWIMDMRDKWIHPYLENDFANTPQKRQLLERKMQSECFKRADRIIAISRLMKEDFEKRHNPDIGKIDIIPNGYDEDDFAEYNESFPPKGDRLKLLLMGNLSWISSTANLVKSVEDLVSGKIIPKDNIEITVYSQSDPKHVNRHLRDPKNNIFKIKNYLPHDRIITALSENHGFILLLNPGDKSVISGRIFEYIRARRPILAFVPEDGEAAQIVKETNTGEVCTPSEPEKMGDLIAKFYSQWQDCDIKYHPNKDAIRKYDRKALTAQLAGIFDNFA